VGKNLTTAEYRDTIERDAAQFAWEESIKVRKNKKHHYSPSTSGTSACGKHLSGLWDNSAEDWRGVTCKRCLSRRPTKPRRRKSSTKGVSK
jgi:DNA-directed RNA polymerase subunit RPC12/RpoP